MATLIEILVSGLYLGSIYALVSLSLNITYLTARVVSFAQGDFGMLVAAGSLYLAQQLGISVFVALVPAFAGAALVAIASDFVAVRSLNRRGPAIASYGWIVSTLGVSIVIQNTTAMWFGTESDSFPSVFPSGEVVILGAPIPVASLATVAASAALVVVFAIATAKSRQGRLARATADNREIAAACGVNVSLVRTGAVAVSAVIVGVATVLSAPQTLVNAFMGTPLLLNGMVATVIGGLGSVGGGLVGGLALGVCVALGGRYLPGDWVNYVPFVMLILWLVLGSDIRRSIVRGTRDLRSRSAAGDIAGA